MFSCERHPRAQLCHHTCMGLTSACFGASQQPLLSSCSLGNNDQSVRYHRTPMWQMQLCAFVNDERANRSSTSLCRSPITWCCCCASRQPGRHVQWLGPKIRTAGGCGQPARKLPTLAVHGASSSWIAQLVPHVRRFMHAISRAACLRSGVGVGWPVHMA